MKRGILLLAIISLIFIVGCDKLPGRTGGDTAPEGPFIGGTQGLEFAFADDEPPSSVLDDNQQQFFITLILKNKGEFTIPEGGLVASLSGISKQAFGLNSLDKVNSLEIPGGLKEGEFVTQGSEELLEFGDATYTIDIPADFSTILRADVCYTYQTNGLTNLCFKKNVLRKSMEDVCLINQPGLVIANSGAPIQVTTIRQNSVGTNKIKVTFTVKNSGFGAVYPPSTFSTSCVGGEDSKDELKVTVTSPEGTFRPVCKTFGDSNTGIIRLVGKEKEVTCTIDTSGMQEVSFQSLLNVQLDYMYREAVQTNIQVQNAY